MRLVFIVVLLAFAGPSLSFSEPFDFNSLTFGEVPRPEMICTGGTCPGDEVPPGKIFYAKYQFPDDKNLFGQTRISAPTYDFSEDGLFRIRFEIFCAPARSDSCTSHVRSFLEEQYSALLVDSSRISHERRIWSGENEFGEEIIVSNDINTAKAFVAIQNKGLIERLRCRANPRRCQTFPNQDHSM